jgi:hypothetical protein
MPKTSPKRKTTKVKAKAKAPATQASHINQHRLLVVLLVLLLVSAAVLVIREYKKDHQPIATTTAGEL